MRNKDFLVAHIAGPWLFELLDPNCPSERVESIIREMVNAIGLNFNQIMISVQRCVQGKPN